jgi:adenosine deaminase
MESAFHPPDPSPEILALPKCNLHSHLEGSVRPATFRELALQQGVIFREEDSCIEDMLQVNGSETSLADYLAKIAVNYSVLKNPAAMRRVAYEAAEDASNDGVVYLELRFGPVTHITPHFTIQRCIESVLEGLQEAETKYGIICRLIVAALRHHDPAINLDLARIAATYQKFGVVGFDLAGDEAAYPASLHQKALLLARESGLGLTVHAGEASGAAEVMYAVRVLGASRIGHGISSTESIELLQLLRAKQIMLEICPTSNLHTKAVSSLDQHPVRFFYDYGIPISIGDDDPITSDTRVSKELTLIRDHFGFSLEEIKRLQLTALEHSFLKEESRRHEIRIRMENYVF